MEWHEITTASFSENFTLWKRMFLCVLLLLFLLVHFNSSVCKTEARNRIWTHECSNVMLLQMFQTYLCFVRAIVCTTVCSFRFSVGLFDRITIWFSRFDVFVYSHCKIVYFATLLFTLSISSCLLLEMLFIVVFIIVSTK